MEVTKFDIFVPLAKVDKDQRMVWGWASTERKDSQGEIIKSDAIKKALPDYMEWANIREMHRPSAVGIAKEADVRNMPDGSGEGLYVGAKIVDDEAWNKVQEGVYKGFSIGAELVAKVANKITDIRLVEISLVDRPANPDCKIEVVKVAEPFEKHAAVGDPNDLEPLDNDGGDIISADERRSWRERIFKWAFGGDVEKKDAPKPYGDVKYADPKHGKYPIDSEEHVRAAWAYINMPKNQEGYSAKEIADIKSHIESAGKKYGIQFDAAKKEAADVGGGDNIEMLATPDTTKSMYTVQDMATAFNMLRCIREYIKSEAGIEGDLKDLKYADKVQEILESMGDLMVAYLTDEIEEEREGDDEDDLAAA